MKLYEAIQKVNGLLAPDSNELFDYILWTSDIHSSFLRTCYKKKSKPLEDKDIEEIKYIIVAIQGKFDKARLNLKQGIADLKLQIAFVKEKDDLEIEIELNKNLGFNDIYVIEN